MDRRRMDAEGGRVVHRDRRAGKLAVVVAVQNLLVIACLLVTLYVHWDVPKDVQKDVQKGDPLSEKDVHIHFDAIADITGNKMLTFSHISSNKSIYLDDKNEMIYITCSGPYILYMDVCYQSRNDEKATGILALKVNRQEKPLWSFNMSDSNEVCKGLHAIVYLREKDGATLHLNSTNEFKIKNVTVGLNYVLGRQCEF